MAPYKRLTRNLHRDLSSEGEALRRGVSPISQDQQESALQLTTEASSQMARQHVALNKLECNNFSMKAKKMCGSYSVVDFALFWLR